MLVCVRVVLAHVVCVAYMSCTYVYADLAYKSYASVHVHLAYVSCL